jgi:hypothetical protein
VNAAAIIALIDAAITLANKIPDAVKVLKKSGELTPEQEAALDAKIAELDSKPHWRDRK